MIISGAVITSNGKHGIMMERVAGVDIEIRLRQD